MLTAFFPGYVITHVPGGILADKLGGKPVLLWSSIISAVISLVTPLSIRNHNSWSLVILRFLLGLSQGVLFPTVSSILAKWVPKHERSTLGAMVQTGNQLGTITSNFFTGLILMHYDWKVVFYIWGVVTLIWAALFFILCSSEPKLHKRITQKELDMLNLNIGATDQIDIPWGKILSDKAVWGLIFGTIGHLVLFFVANVQLPKYMDNMVNINIKKNTVMNTLPYLFMWLSSAICGCIADRMIMSGSVKVTTTRQIFTFIGSVGPSGFLLAIPYLKCKEVAVGVMYCLSLFTMGAFYCGCRVSVLDVTKNFAGIVMALSNGIGSLVFMPVPNVIAWMTEQRSFIEWQTVFWIIAIIGFVTTVVYLVVAPGQRAEWDKLQTATN